MKKIFPVLFLLAFTVCASAADLITATITFTNTPTNGAAFVVNGVTRNWTNLTAASPATLIQTNATPGGSATNLFLHLARYPFSTAHIPARSSSNVLTLKGGVGGAMVITAAGYTSITYATNTASAYTYLVRVPITEEAASNQIAIASLLVKGQSDSSTNSFATNATALAHYATLTTGQTLSNKTVRASVLENSRITNGIVHATNGFISNFVAHSLVITNGTNRGNAFSSPGASGTSSEQFGAGATATNNNATAMGPSALVTGVDGAAFGYASTASAAGTAMGAASFANTNSAAVGTEALATGLSSGAFGASAGASYDNSYAIGTGASTTTSNQIMLGTASIDVVVNNILQAGSITNSTFTGTNNWQGDFAQTINRNGAVLSAVNADVQLTNTFVQFAVSGHFTNAGFVHPGMRDGLRVTLENTNGASMVLLNNSGSESTPERRILTGTGGTVVITNNPGYAELIYRVGSSYTNWVLMYRSN